jgi:hypothetical protein
MNVYIVTEVCIQVCTRICLCMVGVFSSEIQYSLFFAHLECISFIYPESSLNSVFAQCHEMCKRFSELSIEQCWITDKTILFYLRIYVGYFFSCICGAHRTLFWLSAHTKVICNISLDRLRTVYSLFNLSGDFQILFEFKMFHTTIIFKNNLHRFFSGKVQFWKIKYIYHKILFCP